MKTTNIVAPWYIFQKKVKALFGEDPEINVGEVYQPDGGEVHYAFDIEVRNHKKFLALDRVLPSIVEFGNVTMGIVMYDEENSNGADLGIDTFATIFQGNPLVKDIRDVKDLTGTRQGYIRFDPEKSVIQFPADDTGSYDGRMTVLAQDIAREIFSDTFLGIHFCTAGIEE